MKHMGKRKKSTKSKPKKKPIKKRTKKKVVIRSPTIIDYKVRACIAKDIAKAKQGRKKMSKKEARELFDAAFKRCLRQSR